MVEVGLVVATVGVVVGVDASGVVVDVVVVVWSLPVGVVDVVDVPGGWVVGVATDVVVVVGVGGALVEVVGAVEVVVELVVVLVLVVVVGGDSTVKFAEAFGNTA